MTSTPKTQQTHTNFYLRSEFFLLTNPGIVEEDLLFLGIYCFVTLKFFVKQAQVSANVQNDF